MKTLGFQGFRWRRGWDSNPCAIARKLISSQPRYDHFDTSPRCIFKALRVSVRLRAECRNRRTKRRKTVDIQLLKSVDNPEKPEISRVFGDGPSTDLLDFECCLSLADTRLEQVVTGSLVKCRKPRRRKGLRTFRPVSARGDSNRPKVQIKPRSCVKSLRSCAFARSQARKQRPQQRQ